MTKQLKIVLAQLNLCVGNIAHNLKQHIAAAKKARDELKADLIVFPELSLTGYPPEDLLLRQEFIKESEEALAAFIATVKDIHCVVGHPKRHHHLLYNTASVIDNGKILGTYSKQYLPNYGVFDEERYFTPGKDPCVVSIKGFQIGIIICEDLWTEEASHQAAQAGAQLIVSPNASPFESDKHERRAAVIAKRAKEQHIPFFYVNCVGGQDELIFDGGSMVVNVDGSISQLAPFFEETLLQSQIEKKESLHIPSTPIRIPNKIERIYQGLVLSVRDYIHKNHFPGAILGVSGGIDSALTLAIAHDALSANHVEGILMPSRYTEAISLEDAKSLCTHLQVKWQVIPIEPVYQRFLDMLASNFEHTKPDITEENIQARCRAVILMALSNKFGKLVLATGNRSELAVGYCTLYGDMAGGFAPLKDVPKTLVYELAAYRNHLKPVIPERIIERAPTAELAPNQKDEDTLPPYDILDRILALYINDSESPESIAAHGFPLDLVNHLIALIRKNEYKRRQSAIGPRINQKSFGKDWRYPITNGFSKK